MADDSSGEGQDREDERVSQHPVAQAAFQDIEKLLESLTWQWERLPEVEAEIDQWDLIEQLNFIEEWPLEEDRLLRLKRYAEEGLLTPEQIARYDALQGIVARNRPIIRRLQES